MKGIELPVNVLVIIAVAVLVMLALVAMYMAGMLGWGPGAVQSAKTAACGQLMNVNCNENPENFNVNYDATGDGRIVGGRLSTNDNLQVLCNMNLGCKLKPQPPATDNLASWVTGDPFNDGQRICCKQQCGCANIG